MNKAVFFVLSVVLALGVFVGLSAQTVIYTQDFTSTFPPTGWVITNAGSGNDWTLYTSSDLSYNGDYSMVYIWSTSSAANTWAFMQGISMTAGNTYRVEFYQRISSSSYAENMEVTVGNAQTVGSKATTLLTLASVNNTTYTNRVTQDFTPTTSGTYYFAFHCYSAADQARLFVDNVRVYETVPSTVSIDPASFSRLLAVNTAKNDALTITNTGTSNLSITNVTDGAAWLTYSVSTPITIVPNDDYDLDLTLNATGLAAGTYTTTLVLTTNAGTISVPVSLKVITSTTPESPRHVAQWEPARGAIIRYPLGIPDNMIYDFYQYNDELFVVVSSGNLTTAQNYFQNTIGIPSAEVTWIVTPNDTYWIRDYGPISIYHGPPQQPATGHHRLRLQPHRPDQ